MRATATICVLLYGDHAFYAERCLRSIVEAVPLSQLSLRIGLNAVVKPVREWIFANFSEHATIYESDVNMLKYPMMRNMFYADECISTPYVIWFDDDSFILPPYTRGDKRGTWLPEVLSGLSDSVGMVGQIFTHGLQVGQREYYMQQPWYTGRPLSNPTRFVTGGWWCADFSKLRELDYPWAALQHNGGDTALGVAMAQKGYAIRNYRPGVAINADASGKDRSAKRRGVSQLPLGATGWAIEK